MEQPVKPKDADNVPPGAWYALAVLIAIYAFHAVDRGVTSVLMEPIKHEFGLSDAKAGALNSLTHGIAYAFGVLPLGLLGDRANRIKLIAALTAIWSGMTMACGFAPNAITLAATRSGVGLAEGGFAPNALSVIGDSFPHNRRATAIGLFYGATAIGTGLVFAIGGYVASKYGWRAGFLAAGTPGVLLAILLVLSVPEPARGRFDAPRLAGHRVGLMASLALIVSDRSLGFGIIGTVLGIITVASSWAWGVSFFVRVHGLSLGQAGLVMALVGGPVMAIASALAGGLTDHLTRLTRRNLTIVPSIALLVAVPVGLFAFNATSLPWAIGGMIAFGFLQGAWLAQGFGTVLAVTQPHVRSGVMSVTQLFTNLVGTGLSPLLVGFLSDHLGGDGNALRSALTIVILLGIPGSVLLWHAGRLAAAHSTG